MPYLHQPSISQRILQRDNGRQRWICRCQSRLQSLIEYGRNRSFFHIRRLGTQCLKIVCQCLFAQINKAVIIHGHQTHAIKRITTVLVGFVGDAIRQRSVFAHPYIHYKIFSCCGYRTNSLMYMTGIKIDILDIVFRLRTTHSLLGCHNICTNLIFSGSQPCHLL